MINRLSSIGLILLVLAIFSSVLYAQRLGGSYADVKTWTISYRIVVRTKEKCCDIQSEETTEGSPNWTIHYSIFREFTGAYLVGGPIFGAGAPKLTVPNGADTRRSPELADQIVKDIGSKFVGWEQPGPGVAKSVNSNIRVNIKDDFKLISKTEECTRATLSISKTARFDDVIPSGFSHATLGFDLATEHYNLELSIPPINPADQMKVVKVSTTTNTTSTDSSEASAQTKTDETKNRLSDFLDFGSKSVGPPLLSYRGNLRDGTEELSVCQQETVTRFEIDNPSVAKDIQDNKTVSVTVEFTIKKGVNPSSLVEGCR